MKLGIFGGAFNPIHYGHLRTAEEVYTLLSLDKILFIPSCRTPFDKPDLEKPEHRLEMARRAVKGNRHFEVSDVEIRRRGRSYTIDTVAGLKRKYKDSRFYLILGIDAFLDLPYWKEPERLVSLVDLVIISRPGYQFAALASSPYLKNIPVKTLRSLDKGEMELVTCEIPEENIGHLCNVTVLNISASRIRGLAMAGKDIKYLLPDSVKSYIISHKLYVSSV